MTQINESIRQTTAMKHANNLQDTANDLQKVMIEEIKKNNEVTSAHNKAIRLLTIAIVVVGILTVLSNFYNNTGRYAISSTASGPVYVLDTKTSQLWLRVGSRCVYMGTNEKPKNERIETFDPIEHGAVPLE